MGILRKLASAGITAVALLSGSAMAMPIIGSISLSDGIDAISFTQLPNSVVSQLNSVTFSNPGDSSGCMGSFAGACAPANVATSPFTFNALVPGNVWSVGGFNFGVTSVGPISRSALFCVGTGCTDSLSFVVVGVVSNAMAGFTPTQFLGTFQMNGSCTRAGTTGNVCGGSESAAWAAALSADGTVVETPEPVSMSLLGLGLMGAGVLARRRRRA